MGTIVFEDEPPYEQLPAISAKSEPSLDGVLLTFQVIVGETPDDTVPVQVLLEPEVAAALGTGLPTQASVVQRWRKSQS